MLKTTMTGRERLGAVLRKQPKDRLSWTTLVDEATLALVPRERRLNGAVDFYRHLGCDRFLLNGWGTPYDFKSPEHRNVVCSGSCRAENGLHSLRGLRHPELTAARPLPRSPCQIITREVIYA